MQRMEVSMGIVYYLKKVIYFFWNFYFWLFKFIHFEDRIIHFNI